MKKFYLVFIMVLLCGGIFAENRQLVVHYTDIPTGYNINGTKGTIKSSVIGTNDITVGYIGLNTKSEKGSGYKYTVYVKDKGCIFNTNAPKDYYPSSITITFAANANEVGGVGCSFDSLPLTAHQQDNNRSVNKGGTITFVNNNTSKLYWNISTAKANVQIVQVAITYTTIKPTPTVTHIPSTYIVAAPVEVSKEAVKKDANKRSPEKREIDTTKSYIFPHNPYAYKEIRNGQIVIVRNGYIINLLGKKL